MVAQARNLKVLKGRLVTVELSSQDELMRSLFPKWAGQFQNGEPLIHGEQLVTSTAASTTNGHQEEENVASSNDPSHPPSDVNLTASTSACTIVAPYTPPFVTRDEINSLLLLHFSRKCAERPFENILSILAKYPWHQPYRVLPLHRDHIFELLKLSIESLRLHLSKEYNNIQSTLLHRMVRSAILTPAFTERQKNMVLHVAGYTSAPEDLAGWMSPMAPIDVSDADAEDAPSTTPQGQARTEEDNVVEPLSRSKGADDVETVVEDLGMIDAAKSAKPAEQASTASPGRVPAFKGAKSTVPVSWAAVAAPCNNAAGKPSGAHESDKEASLLHASNNSHGTQGEFGPAKVGVQRKTDVAWLNGPAKISPKNTLASKKYDNDATELPSEVGPIYLDSTAMMMSADPKRKFSLGNRVRHNVYQEENTERCTGFSKSF
ncbi:hypothetical protein BGZ72_006258 [Mortierella alpina]|nr:hypothetical protein BGZ72_006258 [Mortierella alpina]